MKTSRLIVLMLACLTIVSGRVAAGTGKVLVVHSYHKGFDWVQEINSSLGAVLKPARVEQRYYYMDTKRKAGLDQIKAAAERAKHLLAEYHPDVVIAVDDNAQEYFAKEYIDKNGVQIVFCGVNADPQAYGYPAANVTGILERSYPVQTLNMLKVLLPAVNNVMVVCDISATADLVLPRIRKLAPKLNPGMQIVGYNQPATFSQWKQEIINLDQEHRVDALLIPLYHTVRRDGGQVSVPSAEVMRWTMDHTQMPVVGLWPQNVINGALLAVTVDPHEHGRVAGLMALEILKGKKAGDIPVVFNKEGYVMVNLRDNKRLALDARVDIDQIADQVMH